MSLWENCAEAATAAAARSLALPGGMSAREATWGPEAEMRRPSEKRIWNSASEDGGGARSGVRVGSEMGSSRRGRWERSVKRKDSLLRLGQGVERRESAEAERSGSRSGEEGAESSSFSAMRRTRSSETDGAAARDAETEEAAGRRNLRRGGGAARRGVEQVAIVEEHFGIEEGGGGHYWANPVVDIIVEEGARVVHSYVQRQSSTAAHTKWTTVQQNTSSTYEFVEVSTGGRLDRHNLHIQQLGPETVTDLSTFHLTSQYKQMHDLHSRLILDHPRGYSRQLHKLIACSEGKGIFDGNIQVNRYAQQTDAGQQTKCLLLSPKAVVNVKPNLQIIADDVKCTHGAAISGDLDPNELFYFQARGVDVKTATDALLFSFGAQVINRIPFKPIEKKALAQLKELLTLSRQSTDLVEVAQ